jgi:hypothetical protein
LKYEQNDTELSKGPSSEYEISEINLSYNKKGIAVKLNFSINYFEGSAILLNTSSPSIQSATNESLFYKESTITLESLTFYKGSFFDLLNNSKRVLKPTSQLVTISLLLANFPVGMRLLKLFQLTKVLRYINIKLPANLQLFFEIFIQSPLEMLPSFLKVNEEEGLCRLNKKIVQNKNLCLIVNNGGIVLLQTAILLLPKLICSLILAIAKSQNLSKSKFIKCLVWVSELMGVKYLYSVILMVQIDMLLYIFINIRSASWTPFHLFWNSLLTVLLLAGIITFTLFMAVKLRKMDEIDLDDEEIVRSGKYENISRWVFLIERLKKNQSFLAKNFRVILFIKDTVICFFVMMFLEVPFLQIVPVVMYYWFLLAVAYKNQPFEYSTINLMVNTSESLNCLIMMLFFVMFLFQGKMDEKLKYEYIGNLVILLIFIGILFYIIFGIIKSVMSYRQMKELKKKSKVMAISRMRSELNDHKGKNGKAKAKSKGKKKGNFSVKIGQNEESKKLKSVNKPGGSMRMLKNEFGRKMKANGSMMKFGHSNRRIALKDRLRSMKKMRNKIKEGKGLLERGTRGQEKNNIISL